MPRGKTRIAMFALIGVSALLVGFHGASTLMTLTQVAASPGKLQQPKAHASLVPKPALPVRAKEPTVAPAEIAAQPAASTAAANLADLAAAATAQAQLVELPVATEEPPPRRERQRRYRAPRPDLHRVY